MKQLVKAGIVAALVLVVLALIYLPWWALVLSLIAGVAVGRIVLKKLMHKALVTPFKMKGAVLQNASAEVHEIASAADRISLAELQEDCELGDDAPLRLPYELEVTIRPGESTTPFQWWEPGELTLVDCASIIDPEKPDQEEPDDSCVIVRRWIHEQGSFKEDQGCKYQGTLRLKLWLLVKPGVPLLKFRYYFEEFGLVNLPSENQISRVA